jgi:3'(2'),5'-bisphosphate nucleotidase
VRADDDVIVRALLDLSARAAELVLKARDRGFEVSYKAPLDPVTTADVAANELICSELAKQFPGVPLVAEESAPESYAAYTESATAFFIDPIDGTREFVGGSSEFVVMIGFATGGRADVGVVCAPLLGQTWFGKHGVGAWSLTGGHAVRIETSRVTNLPEATLLVSPPASLTDPVAASLGPGKVQSVGSAGLKGARIAEGSADVYVSLGVAGKLWDACAIDALLRAAGGTLTDTKGRALDYRHARLENDHGLLATNGPLLDPVIARLA